MKINAVGYTVSAMPIARFVKGIKLPWYKTKLQ